MSSFSIRCSKLLVLLLLAVSPLVAQDNSTARRPFGQHTVSFSATPIFDAGLSDSFKITLTGNVTSSTLIGAEAGHTYTFEICQDGVGSRTFTWPSQMVGPVAILSGANVCTQEIFPFDGTSAINPTTTTSGGGGSGTVNAGTTGQVAYYGANGTTVSGNTKLDEGTTNANGLTYTGTAGIFSPLYTGAGTGALTFIGTEGTCSGAAAGKVVLCIGDLVSNSFQTSLNGGSFLPVPQLDSTSPVPHGVMLAETFPTQHASSRGSQGQPFLEGALAGDPGFGALDISNSANVVNRLQKGNALTTVVYTDQTNTAASAMTLDMSGATASGAFRTPNIAGVAPILNGALAYDTTSNNFHGGLNGADSKIAAFTITPTNTFCAQWVVVSGHYELGQATGTCGTPGGAGALSGITAATTSNTIANGDNAQVWQTLLTTAGKTFFRYSESGPSTATGTPWIVGIDTVASSTANPWKATALGTTNGVGVLKSSFLTSLGAGGIDSNMLHCDVTTSTKCVLFGLSGISAATTRTWSFQDASDTVVGRATTDTLTNKTADAEGTGNVLTRPFYVSFSAACNNTTAGPGAFNVPTSAAATFSCTGTTTTQGQADFVDGSTTSLTTEAFTLPQGWVGNVDVRLIWWANAASSNAVRWSVSSGCVADGTAVNTGPSYNTASAANTSYTGTANQRKTTLLSAISASNCAAGSSVYFQIQRIGADAGDTLTATAELIEFQIEGRTTK